MSTYIGCRAESRASIRDVYGYYGQATKLREMSCIVKCKSDATRPTGTTEYVVRASRIRGSVGGWGARGARGSQASVLNANLHAAARVSRRRWEEDHMCV